MDYCGPRALPLSKFLSWDQHDQDAALAWQGYERQRCNQCGYHPLENADGTHVHAETCPGCVARSSAGKSEAAKAPGVVIHLARGAAGTCDTCRAALIARHAPPP